MVYKAAVASPCRLERAKGWWLCAGISLSPYSVSQNSVMYPHLTPRETVDSERKRKGLGDGYTVCDLVLLIPETFR